MAARAKNCERIFVGPVIQPQHDDGFDIRPERARAPAPLRGRREPVHVAVRAVGEKARQPLLCVRNGVRRGDTDSIEAACLRFAGERVPKLGRIVQKSKSA